MKNKNIKENFKKATGINPIMGDDTVNIGYCLAIDSPVFVKKFFSEWVRHMDSKMDNVQKHSIEYADLLHQRFFTFDEYKLVISGKINEENFSRSKAFEFLYLDDSVERDIFTINNQNEDLNLLEQYIKLISTWIRRESPILKKYFFDTRIPINLTIESLKKHVYILARSGAGKSELLKIIMYDLQRTSQKKRNRTLICLEPHSDLTTEILSFALNKGNDRNRLIYLDPDIRGTAKALLGKDIFDRDYHFIINPFDVENSTEKDIPSLTEYLSDAFFSIVNSSETYLMETCITACVETLLRYSGTDISDLKRFMDDSKNEDLVKKGSQIPNLIQADFLNSNFKSDSRLSSTKNSIAMRLQRILGNSFFYRMVTGQSTVNLETEMNSGKVILMNLNKPIMGPLASIAAGRLIVALMSAYAFKRLPIPKNQRMDTFLCIDEFQSYINHTFGTILAEARKFRIFGVFANQQMGQNMDSQMKRIIAGNTAIKFMGENEPQSLEWMSSQMKHLTVKSIDLLPKYAFWVNDRFTKKAGSFINRVPSFLVDKNSKFYLRPKELEDLFLYLVHDSGIYVPTEIVKYQEPQQELENVTLDNPFVE